MIFREETNNIFYVFNCLLHAFTEEIKVTKSKLSVQHTHELKSPCPFLWFGTVTL